jgi:carboxyl-terminal processing protease
MLLAVWLLAVPALAIPEGGDEKLVLLEEIAGYIETYSLYPPDNFALEGVTAEALEEDPELFDETVSGWLSADKYGYLITHEEYNDLFGITEGAGIGVFVDGNMPTGVYVTGFEPGGAAEDCGMAIGAQIVSVDGADISDRSLYEASEYVLGTEGTAVTVGYMNPGSAEIHFVELIRRDVSDPTFVDGYILKGTDIGYISIGMFAPSNSTGGYIDSPAADVFFDLYNHTLPEEGAESLIIDLRDNKGGSVDTAYLMLCYMLDGEIPLFETISASGTYDNTFFSVDWTESELEESELPDGIWEPKHIVILVNGNTASASEIFCGALKGNGLAELVGEVTYGKAHQQALIPLKTGDYLGITSHQIEPAGIGYYEETGIAPDHAVAFETQLFNEGSYPDINVNLAIFPGTKQRDRVLGLQERLALIGYYRAEPTGELDEYTVWALNRFQAWMGLRRTPFASVPALRALEYLLEDAEIFDTDSQLDYAIDLCS